MTPKLCDHLGYPYRVDVSISIKCGSPIGMAELEQKYEVCVDCATCLTTGDMKKGVKKALKEIIEKNKRT
ncbi:MAG: hypothetical protein ACUZ8I_07710 [Candidatus Scalindua sp.]